MREQPGLLSNIAALKKAIKQHPRHAELQINLGVYLQQAGDLEGAVQSYRRAIAIKPASHEAYNNLGQLFASLGERTTALTFFNAAVSINSNVAEVHNNLANIHIDQGNALAAIESYRKAIALDPLKASLHVHLGNALRLEERYSEAAQCLHKALALRPRYAEAYVNLGVLSYEQQDFDRAEAYNRMATDCDPELAQAHLNLGHLLLRRGDWIEGWREQEWRWRWKAFPSPRRNFTQPKWEGQAIEGQRILLHAEQGFGDTIQMLRYLPLVAERGADIILEIHPELLPLAGKIAGISKLIARGDLIPPFDWHCPLMSLPLAFSTTLATIPCHVPYLHAGLDTPAWLNIDDRQRLRVGLVWAGSPTNVVDRKRSLSLPTLTPLLQVKGVSFCSLQRGAACDEDESLPFPFASVLPEVADFAETAAAVSNLDLIISVDTAVAHLAGALGKPVWILLPKLADWRWMVDREDSPWYPTATLLRQQVPGQWGAVVTRMAGKLSAAVARKRQGQSAAQEQTSLI